jgi:hypothetical protein
MPVQPQVLFLLEEHPVATNASVMINAREVIFISFFIISLCLFY